MPVSNELYRKKADQTYTWTHTPPRPVNRWSPDVYVPLPPPPPPPPPPPKTSVHGVVTGLEQRIIKFMQPGQWYRAVDIDVEFRTRKSRSDALQRLKKVGVVTIKNRRWRIN